MGPRQRVRRTRQGLHRHAPAANANCLLLVNGFGGSPAMELYLMVNAARCIRTAKGLNMSRYLTGSYVTNLDMAGYSLTVSVLDQETEQLWDAPVSTPAQRW
jgi:dihydroxyacetone kinase-like protein